MSACVDDRLPRGLSEPVSQILDLLRAAEKYEVGVHADVASWLAGTAADPDGWSHREVQELLRWDPSEGLYEEILVACEREATPLRARGEVVGGVCLAYLELIGAVGGRVGLGRTFEREEAYLPVSAVVLRRLTPIACHGLTGIDELAPGEASLLPGEIFAVILGAVGAASCTNRELALEALDGVSGFGLPSDPDFGRFADVWSFGLRKLTNYLPNLDERRLPGSTSL